MTTQSRIHEMHTLLCTPCDGLGALYAVSDGGFACETCGGRLTERDVLCRLEDHEIWTVHPTGELGYMENPVMQCGTGHLVLRG
ncbi:hypothetical protein [Streptomyces sp. NPDC058657]|uniref:hypothetical protein n=1 Tax=unclassified Streptomyces TaxID=2593676 RepID=UPI003647D484